MHFYIEHATLGIHLKSCAKLPDDGATAKISNQNDYSYWITSVTKQCIDAWKKQMERLKGNGNSLYLYWKRHDVVCINTEFRHALFALFILCFSTKGLHFCNLPSALYLHFCSSKPSITLSTTA